MAQLLQDPPISSSPSPSSTRGGAFSLALAALDPGALVCAFGPGAGLLCVLGFPVIVRPAREATQNNAEVFPLSHVTSGSSLLPSTGIR
jgi:hypothetical protein